MLATRRQVHVAAVERHPDRIEHDASRPFLVHAGDAVVRAVGTEFEVRVLPDQHVAVVVNEGRVEVRPAITPAAQAPARALAAGQRMSTANQDYAITTVSAEQLSSELAWREGAIIFDGQRLADAIVEVERYTDVRIIVSDPATAALQVGGRFRTGDVQ